MDILIGEIDTGYTLAFRPGSRLRPIPVWLNAFTMLTLRDVLAMHELGLRALSEDPPLGREVRWAHVSELADPSPWMLGGEILLTTGLNLVDTDEFCDAYCRRLVNAEIAAIGISTGPSLPHSEVPERLLNAARRAELPVILIPEHTLMQSVVHAVSDSLHEHDKRPLLDSLSHQQQLNAAATAPDGIGQVLAQLHGSLGFAAVVYDSRLRQVAACDPEDALDAVELREDIRSHLREGMRWSLSADDGARATVALPLGTEGRLRGILVAGKSSQVTVQDRAALGTAASLLSVLLELRHSISTQTRLMHARALDAVLVGDAPVGEAAALLRRSGITAERFAVLAVSQTDDADALTALIANASDLADEVLVRTTATETALVLCDPAPDAALGFERLVRECDCAPAGSSEIVDLMGLRDALRQARFAQSTARLRGVGYLARADFGGYEMLARLGRAEERAAYADAVLSRIDEADASGRHELFRTLSAFIGNASNIEATAEELQVHRHTVRARLGKISELSGRRLGHAPDLLELWLAVAFREIADYDAPRPAAERDRQGQAAPSGQS